MRPDSSSLGESIRANPGAGWHPCTACLMLQPKACRSGLPATTWLAPAACQLYANQHPNYSSASSCLTSDVASSPRADVYVHRGTARGGYVAEVYVRRGTARGGYVAEVYVRRGTARGGYVAEVSADPAGAAPRS